MPAELYEIVALAARFWFLFLMVLIVWRSYRWYARERRQYKKRLRFLPDAGYIGELVVMQTAGGVKQGKVFPVPFEGTLGYTGSNDLSIPAPGISNRHIWFSYDKKKGLKLIPLGRNDFAVDHLTIAQQPKGLYMAHGSRLYVGECELRLRMFAGYEVLTAHNPVSLPAMAGDERRYGQLLPDPQEPPRGLAAWQQPAPYGQPNGTVASYAPYGQPCGTAAPQHFGYPVQQAAPGRPQPAYDPYGMQSQPASVPPVYQQPVQAVVSVQPSGQQPVQPAAPAQHPVSYAPVRQSVQQSRPAAYTSVVQGSSQPNPYARPMQPPDEAAAQFHPLMDDGGWEDFAMPEDDDFDEYGDDEGSVQPAAPAPGKEQKAATEKMAPAGSVAAAPQGFYPLETSETEESWPYLARPDEWRSEGLFDDLLDEDGTDAAAPSGRAYRGGGSL
ncbi:MAG: hypothetical protein IJ041_00380 [Clostridia bacterium]|nr:hypothetical protein [Clostridia bacterium]